jgi:hypothetical protein
LCSILVRSSMFLLDLGVLFFRSCFGRHWSGLGCRLDFLHALFFAIQFHSCAARSRSSRSLLLCVVVFFGFSLPVFYLHSQLYSLVKHRFSLICVLLVLDFLPADHRSGSCFAVPNFSWRLDSVNRVEVFVSRAHSALLVDVARGPVLVPQRFVLPIFLCTWSILEQKLTDAARSDFAAVPRLEFFVSRFPSHEDRAPSLGFLRLIFLCSILLLLREDLLRLFFFLDSQLHYNLFLCK